MQIINQIAIIGFIKLSTEVASANGEALEQSIIKTEMDELRKLAEGTLTYTESYATKDYVKDTKNYAKDDKSRVLCKIMDKYCKIFTMLYRLPGPPKYQCEEDKRVVELQRFDTTDTIMIGNKRMTPERWIDYVIFYSLEKRYAKIEDDNIFLGVAIYSQRYYVEDIYRDTLIENMFQLYIRPTILRDPKAFHNKIYKGGSDKLRNETDGPLLESVMKVVTVRVLEMLGIPFRIKGRILSTYAYTTGRNPTLDDWCKKRSIRLTVPSSNLINFDNIILKGIFAANNASAEDKITLLALVGMIRSGRHTVSIRCRDWVPDKNFQDVIDLVNTNRNLVGVTELRSGMKLENLLGGIKQQLRYIEISFWHNNALNNRAMNFLESLNKLEMKVWMNFYKSYLIKKLLAAGGIVKIKRLSIRDGSYLLASEEMAALVMNSEKAESLELHNCRMTLEEFIVKGHFMQLKRKLRVLGVAGIGDLSELSESLGESRLEKLDIGIKTGDTLTNMNQLADVITDKNFRYLIFTNMSSRPDDEHPDQSDICKECVEKILDLKDKLRRMRFEHLPAILANFNPIVLENIDCSYAADTFYEIHL